MQFAMSIDDDDNDKHLQWARFYAMSGTLAANLVNSQKNPFPPPPIGDI